MAEEEIWRVTDLLDAKQPFVEDVQLARQMVQTLHALDAFERESVRGEWTESGSVYLNVRTPRAALEFVENTLSEWFETVAEIEKRRGNLPYLIDRSLYPGGEIDWNQGLTKSDLDSWLIDSPNGIGDYPFMNPSKPTGDPLSGYFNRILPVKFVLRMLAVLTLSSENFDKEEGWEEGELDTVTLTDLREDSWKTANYAKSTLVLIDKYLKSETGAGFSVGFPGGETPQKEVKSKERFVSQFVGSRRKGELSGALFDMGFANIRSFLGMSTDEVWFTRFGWHFALMENPVIDQIEGWQEAGRFSEKEVEFLLAHFKENVPAEWDFMNSIARMISTGIDDATKMNAELISSMDWNRSKASVYRTGVLARMQELGLVDRIKSGVEVKFTLTEAGKTNFALK